MGNGLRTVQGIQMVHQRIHPVFYDFIVFKWDTAVFDAQIFIKCDPFPDIKGMLQLDSGLMELCHQIHALLHIRFLVDICISGIFIIFCDLIAGIPVKIDHMLCNSKIRHCLQHISLLMTVDQQSCTGTWNPADIRFAMNLEQE